MKNKEVGIIVYASFKGGAIGLLGIAIAMLGHNSVRKEYILFSIGLGLFALAEIVCRGYKLGGNINPNITNPKLINFFTRYPFFARVISMIIGISVLAVCLHFLDTTDPLHGV